MKKLKVSDIVTQFELEVISGKDQLDEEINVYGINRAGLELAGYFEEGKNGHRLILMSTKEYQFMQNFDATERKKRYQKLIESGIPGIIVTQKFKDEILFDVTKACNFPVLRCTMESTSEFSCELLEYQDDYFAPTIEVHGSLVNIFGKGVLIIGESGIGKSEITLELVKKNHLFVGDDRIFLKRKANKIYGKSHPILLNLVEVRGIGIINIAETHGYQVVMDESAVDIMIELVDFKKNGVDDYERLGNDYDSKKFFGVKVPHIRIPVSSGRNISNVVEMAVSQLKVMTTPHFHKATEVMEERIKEYQEEGND